MLAATAVVRRCTLREAQVYLRNSRPQAAARVLDRMFGGIPADDDPDDSTGGGTLAPAAGPVVGKARQRDRLLALWSDATLVAHVEAAESILWAAPSQAEFYAWLRERHLASVAQAVRAAALDLASDVAEDDLIVDLIDESIDASSPSTQNTVFHVAVLLTETSPGGLGQIEAVAARMRADPEAFEDAFRHALDYCPREVTSMTLLQVLEAARRPGPARQTGPGSVAAALAQVRAARGHTDADLARQALSAALDREGIDPTRDALVAVIGRLARPGSGRETDALARGLNRAWRRHELRIGMSIDPRVFAYLCVENRALRRRVTAFLRRLAGGAAPADHQLFAAVEDMLLSSCHDSCPECLDQGHLFDGFSKPSRDLTRRWLDLNVTRIEVDGKIAWLDRARVVLRDKGRVAVCAPRNLVAHAGRGIQMLLAEEIERDFVMAPVSLAGVARSPDGWTMQLRLRAAAHV
jgi:hypothetical protein